MFIYDSFKKSSRVSDFYIIRLSGVLNYNNYHQEIRICLNSSTNRINDVLPAEKFFIIFICILLLNF